MRYSCREAFGEWVCDVASEPYASETDNIISSHGPRTIAEEACEQKLPVPILLIREVLVSKSTHLRLVGGHKFGTET